MKKLLALLLLPSNALEPSFSSGLGLHHLSLTFGMKCGRHCPLGSFVAAFLLGGTLMNPLSAITCENQNRRKNEKLKAVRNSVKSDGIANQVPQNVDEGYSLQYLVTFGN